MPRTICVNLPVKDLKTSRSFFEAMGFSINQQFSNDTTACMVVVDAHITVMLMAESFFKTFMPKDVADAKTSCEMVLCVGLESRETVNDMVKNAVAAGGRTLDEPSDYGFMYSYGFEDLDGHLWNLLYMDPNAAKPE